MEVGNKKNNQTASFGFGKRYHLRHTTIVDALFKHGKSIFSHPLRMVWRVADTASIASSFRTGLPPRVDPVQIMVMVGKKKRRHAVDRVLMRRRIREAVRIRALPALKTWSIGNPGKTINLAILYIHNDNSSYAEICKAVDKLMEKLWIKITTSGEESCAE